MGKTVGQVVGGVVGGIAGFLYAGPVGANLGFTIGSGLGGAIDPPKGPTIKVPGIGDLQFQTNTYGADIGRTYGGVGVAGNLLWLEGNDYKRIITKTRQGGKGGGGGATVEKEHAFATFAVRICDNEIAGVNRLWMNGQLISNFSSENLETIVASKRVINRGRNAGGNYVQSVTDADLENYEGQVVIYNGADDQEPDPRIEADLGVGNAPAWRGTAYAVFYDWPLRKLGNTMLGLQCVFEVIGAASLLPKLLDSVQLVPEAHYFNGFWGGVDNDANAVGWGTNYDNTYPSSGSLNRYKINVSGGVSKSVAIPNPGFVGGPASGGNSDSSDYALVALGTPTYFYHASNYYYGPRSILPSDISARWCYRYGELFVLNITSGIIRKIQPVVYGFGSSSYINSVDYVGMLAIDYDGEILVAVSADGIRLFDSSLNLLATNYLLWDFDTQLGRTFCSIENEILYVFNNGNLFVVGNNYSEILIAVENFHSPDWSDTTNFYVKGSIAYIFDDGLINRFSLNSFDVTENYIDEVVANECKLSEVVQESDLDLTQLSAEPYKGFRLSGIKTPRANITPLMQAYFFDLISSGYKIKAVKRGGAVAGSIDWNDLACTPFGGAPVDFLQREREMDTMLPNKILVGYLDADRAYEKNSQPSYERSDSAAASTHEIDLPLVLTANEGAGIADVTQDLGWLQRAPINFSLPPKYRAMEPADLWSTVDRAGNTYVFRLQKVDIQQDGLIEISAFVESQDIYTPDAVGSSGATNSDNEIAYPGGTDIVLMDIPMMRDEDDIPGFATAVYTESGTWPGAVLYVSNDGEASWENKQGYNALVTMGTFREAIGADEGLVRNKTLTLTVDLLYGELESVADAITNGVNYFAYGNDQRWGIGQFENAVLQSDGSYELSMFLLGQRGTEWVAAEHQAGDWFVLLDDPDVIGVGANISLMGVERYWRCVTSGRNIGTAESQLFAYRGNNLKPLSPVHGDVAASGADWVYTWDPRTRYESSYWVTGVLPPVGETEKKYEIDVMDGSAVVATYTVTNADEWTYEESRQIADFGSAQMSPPTINVYQISSRVGRGRGLEIAA